MLLCWGGRGENGVYTVHGSNSLRESGVVKMDEA